MNLCFVVHCFYFQDVRVVAQPRATRESCQRLDAKRRASATQQDGLTGADCDLHVRVVDPAITEDAAQVADGTGSLLAPGRAEKGFDIFGGKSRQLAQQSSRKQRSEGTLTRKGGSRICDLGCRANRAKSAWPTGTRFRK